MSATHNPQDLAFAPGLTMSQPGITEPVTDGDSNPLASQPRPQDSSCLDGESTNHEPVGQSSPDDRHPQGTPKACVNGDESKKNSKRKRASKNNRNVKPKSDATSRDGGDLSLTQILGPSLDVLFATHTPLPDSDSSLVESDPSSEPQPVSPVAATSKTAGVNSRAARKPTRLAAVKQQLKLQMEENVRLVNSMRLLEREIDDKNKAIEKLKKCEASQKTQIKKLSKGNDTLRRELLGRKGMDKSASNNCMDMQQKCNCDKTYVSSDLSDLKDQVVSAANSLLAAVGINDTGFSNVKNRRTKPTVNSTKVSSASSLCPVQTDQVVSSDHRSSTPGLSRGLPRQPSSASHPRQPSSASHPRQPSSASQPRQPSSASSQVPDKPSVAIIGTSLVRGLAHRVSRQQVSATSFMYPGCELPVLRDRVPAIFSGDFNPDVVVLQCAGNDLANGHPVAEVVQQLDSLIHDIKSRCPDADIIVNKIPPRGHNNELLKNIEMVNEYISDMSKAKGSRVFSSDACPKSFRYYRKDEIHFNHKGKQFFAQEMLKVLNFPRLRFQKKR